jgi:hypothetical protein
VRCELLFLRVHELGGRLFLDGDRMGYRLPDTREGQELLAELRQNQDSLLTMLRRREADPASWSEAFHHWALDRCVYRERWFNAIWALHKDFRDWFLNREEVPCDRATFEQLVLDAGFLLEDGFVKGLTLKRDYETYEPLKTRTVREEKEQEEHFASGIVTGRLTENSLQRPGY